jgi:hypothetical protein
VAEFVASLTQNAMAIMNAWLPSWLTVCPCQRRKKLRFHSRDGGGEESRELAAGFTVASISISSGPCAGFNDPAGRAGNGGDRRGEGGFRL